MSAKHKIQKVLYHLFVIIFGIIMIYPVFWMISGSFKDNAEILRGTLSLVPENLKISNYSTELHLPPFLRTPF